MSKVFITGVNGFLGQAISTRLLKDGHEVHGLVFHENSPKIDGVKGHYASLLDYDRVGQILHTVQPEIILHLAARTEVEKSFYDPIDFSTVNYSGTVNMIEKAKDLSNLKLFMFASTMETYGEVFTKEECKLHEANATPICKPFDEDTPQKPNAPYAVAKIACEYYLKYAERAYDFPWTALRQTNTFGRVDNDFFVVEQIITQMLKNPDKIELGYKDPFRNFLYVDDLVDLYSAIVENPEKVKGELFTIGPDNALTIGALVDKIAGMLGWKGTVDWDKKPARVGEIYYLNSTNEKITEYLGWKPVTTLDEGLIKTIETWKKNLGL